MKRGISPLIATILLIGFTIVLAALIMTWGKDIYNYYKEKTEFSGELELACSKLFINAKELCVLGDTVNGQIENKGNINISNIMFRIKGRDGSNLINWTSLPIYTINKINFSINLHHYNWSLAYNEAVGEPATLEIIPKVLIKINSMEKEGSCSNLIKKVLEPCYKLPDMNIWSVSGNVKIINNTIKPSEAQYSATLKSPFFVIPNVLYIYTKINVSGSHIKLKLNSESEVIIEENSGYYIFDRATDIRQFNGKNTYFTIEMDGNSLEDSVILYENCYSNGGNCII